MTWSRGRRTCRKRRRGPGASSGASRAAPPVSSRARARPVGVEAVMNTGNSGASAARARARGARARISPTEAPWSQIASAGNPASVPGSARRSAKSRDRSWSPDQRAHSCSPRALSAARPPTPRHAACTRPNFCSVRGGALIRQPTIRAVRQVKRACGAPAPCSPSSPASRLPAQLPTADLSPRHGRPASAPRPAPPCGT